jgi:hypothetical protein
MRNNIVPHNSLESSLRMNNSSRNIGTSAQTAASSYGSLSWLISQCVRCSFPPFLPPPTLKNHSVVSLGLLDEVRP